MKRVDEYDIINLRARWDIMNNNLLISTAMLSAYWEKEKKDILDLMMPFLKYSIGKTTKVGHIIDLDTMVSYFKKEFGYETMPKHVFSVLLNRLSPNYLDKTKGKYTLKKSLDDEIIRFERGHALYQEHRSKVVSALTEYLNDQQALNRRYNQETAMSALINFFATNGMCIIKDTMMLELLKKKDDQQKYYISQFIVEEHAKKSEVFSYIEDMVKGFFVSAAISIQPQNIDVVQSKFRELNCFLDTRIIINALGLHLPEEKVSTLELLKMLTEKGAKLYCFEHNVQEVLSIINAYRYGLSNPHGNNSPQTLEAWDSQHYTISDVDRYASLLRAKISRLGITIEEKPCVSDASNLPFEDSVLVNHIDENMNYYKREAIETDVNSVISILLLRNGHKTTEIEKSKYVFVTSNVHLTNIVNTFLLKNSICNFHEETMPIITDIDLSSIVWLKCYSTHKDFPKQKLIEQSLTALEPTPTMMITFFEMVDRLQHEGGITADEAAILRTDAYCKKELSGLVKGNVEGITEETVYEIREKLKLQYVGDANRNIELNYQKYSAQKEANRRVITKAIEEIESVGKAIFESTRKVCSIAAWMFFGAMFVGLALVSLFALDFASLSIPSGILAVISFIGIIDMLLAKKSKIYHIINWIAHSRADRAKDLKREEYEKILDSNLSQGLDD